MSRISDWFRSRSRAWYLPVARLLTSWGISPNMVSLAGAAAFAGAGVLAGAGRFAAAGWVIALLGPLDRVDGLMAREFGLQSRFGAFLDSTLDRVAEILLFLGILAGVLRFQGGGVVDGGVILCALSGSLLVSYARARAEALGFECKVGLMTRFERLFLVSVGLIFGFIMPVMWFLAVATHLTALQRILHVYGQRMDQEGGDGPQG